MSQEKREKIGTISVLTALFIIIAGSWFYKPLQEITAIYATLITAVALGIAFLCYVDLKHIFREPAFYLMVFADVLTLVNLFVIDSGKGALLTVVDLLLVLYLAERLILSKLQVWIISAVELAFFFYWTLTPKGYYQGFNINYGGLVLLTGLVFGMLLLEMLKQEDKYPYLWIGQIVLTLIGCRVTYVAYKDIFILYGIYIALTIFILIKRKELQKYFWVIQATLMILGFEIISYYLSRCALVGALVFTVLILIPQKFWKNTVGKVFYWIITYGLTIGTVLFSLLMVWLGSMRDTLNFKLLYKDIFSGREEVWGELWGEYRRHPITGMGSSYQLHVDNLEGTFEVHNGLLDILFVHGLIVFIIALCFLISLLLRQREQMISDVISKFAMAGVFAMLTTSFFENNFIDPPFMILFMLLFGVIGMRRKS